MQRSKYNNRRIGTNQTANIRRRGIVPKLFETKLLAMLEINENYIDINRVPLNEFATFVVVLGRAGAIFHRCVLQTLENTRLVLFYITSCSLVLKVEYQFTAS